FQFLFLPIRHDGKRHVEGVFGAEPCRVGNGKQLATDSHYREGTNFQVQIRRKVRSCGNQQIVNFYRHRNTRGNSLIVSKSLRGYGQETEVDCEVNGSWATPGPKSI